MTILSGLFRTFSLIFRRQLLLISLWHVLNPISNAIVATVICQNCGDDATHEDTPSCFPKTQLSCSRAWQRDSVVAWQCGAKFLCSCHFPGQRPDYFGPINASCTTRWWTTIRLCSQRLSGNCRKISNQCPDIAHGWTQVRWIIMTTEQYARKTNDRCGLWLRIVEHSCDWEQRKLDVLSG